LIELAKIVKKKPKKFANNNYLFVAFTGEELGLIGSKRFVERLEFKVDFMNYMINMDMIGMLDSTNKTLVINGVGTSPAWNTTLDKMSYPTKKIEKIKTTESGIGASDHSSFYLNGVPAVHFFTGQHEFYHKPEDDIERVNYGGTAFVISYICQFMERMDKQGRVEFTKTKQEEKGRRSFSVTLGVMPDYIYDGEGMRIDGVRDGKPGSVAGLESGDIVVNLNGTSILNIQDYMKVLSSLKKGDKVPISIKRNDTIILKEVQF
jgi:membrane-associated protease RseP (regulator of RpoE activity)